jgi:outer membrane lipoprotein-sorting protein
MNKNLIIKYITGCILMLTVLTADDIKARAIMEKVDARDDGKTLEQNMQMILINKNGKKRVRHLKSYSKDFGRDEYQIMFFIAPSDVKNTGFLTYDYRDAEKEDDQWLYLPALKKVKRIPSKNKSASFMGSDFSYFDLVNRNLQDYDFKLLNDTTIKGHAVWAIEAIPRSVEIMKRSGYTKTVAFVRKDNYVIVRSIGFLKNGRVKYFDLKRMHQQQGIWVVDEIDMTTKKGKKMLHKTILKFFDIKLNQPISNSTFTTRRLEKGL